MLFLSIISNILPIIFFLVFKQRNKEKILWVICIYAVFSSLIDFFSPVLEHLHIIYPNTLNSLFTIIEYSFFAYFLYYNYNSKSYKYYCILGSIIFAGFAFYNLADGSQSKFDSYPASVESILLISYCILFFYGSLKSQEIELVYSSKNFWIVSAILFYLAATFILFISTIYMTKEEKHTYWSINLIANIVKNLLLAYAFLMKPKEKNTKSKIFYNIPEKQH
jgi:hypothetical protein